MAGDSEEMTREEIRAALLAKIAAAWPKYADNAELAREVRLASNDELRKHLAMAEMIAEVTAEPMRPKPEAATTLSPRYTEADRAAFGRIHRTAWNPSGSYTLAKDVWGEQYTGPSWVPMNLKSHAEYDYGNPLVRECAKTLIEAAGAEKLWSDIADKHGQNPITLAKDVRLDWIASGLPMVCAEARAGWATIPRLKPSEFKKQREELARRAEQLAIELERFYLPRDPDECELPGLMDFAEMMSQEEVDKFDQAIRITTFRIANRARKRAGVAGMDWAEYNDIGEDAKALGYSSESLHTLAREDAIEVYALMQRDHTRPDLPYGGVPTLPDMLRRIARKFEEDADYPPIKNPNLANAERNFFARALCKYFWTSYGNVSPAIVRDIVTMFYPQGITENDVSQMIAKIKAAHPLPVA